ncbi:kinase-like domain-containing protein [Boletus reticuloceps]|uniref:Kinase-like domain-containing protein n=1 Tax=Boletus reticuloceps TaxID=495285 RepID=A0A8I2YEL1_9AGAM|nr:kinase-like domain-containing protein [Boletus reticuloceps]
MTPLERDPSCMMYLAKTEEGNHVVVKFVTRYGADAYLVMAAAGFVPKLLYHGVINIKDDIPSYGNTRMVVMEYVEGMTLHDAIQGKICLSGFSASLRKAIEFLHHQNFVFGDLREPNIMVTPDRNVQLIDFNWAGQEGVVTYPPLISPSIP